MSKVIMTSVQLVERLKALADRRTWYKNKYPYNLCYNHADGTTSADCVNLYKSVLNGYDVNNHIVGYFQNNLSNTGDCTEKGLLDQCTDVSGDFKKLKSGEPRILYKDGHIGGYIGEEVTKDGHIYNVIECTSAWQGGILYSYVDSIGRRYQYKNGAQNGAWSKHGKMTPWVQYIEPNLNTYNGVDYSLVFDWKFYKNFYEDLRKAFGNNNEKYIEHFVKFGMNEGRMAKEDFNVWVYQFLYPDLQKAYGDNIDKYYLHYMKFGYNEHREAKISFFAHVYNAKQYVEYNKDLEVLGGDENRLIKHFVQHGMKEARRASEDFNVKIYKENYKDLRDAFGDNYPSYYLHYIQFGYAEHREAVKPIRHS